MGAASPDNLGLIYNHALEQLQVHLAFYNKNNNLFVNFLFLVSWMQFIRRPYLQTVPTRLILPRLRYVLTKRRTGLIVVSLFVWSNIRPSVFYKKKIEYLKLLHQRLFLLLRLCQLVRSISEYTNELWAFQYVNSIFNFVQFIHGAVANFDSMYNTSDISHRNYLSFIIKKN